MQAEKHENRGHALLSPSGASRWMNCTKSARVEEHIESKASPYAREGTLAHELSETELRLHFGLISKEQYKAKIAEIEADELYTHDMPDNVEVYTNYCIEQYNSYKAVNENVSISIEDKIDLCAYIEDGYGSNDCVIVANTVLEVIDLKYGRGVSVSAIENSQLKLYGLGALYVHELIHDITEVKLTIIQPRTGNISSYIISPEELKRWGEEEVKVKAAIAFSGEGEFKAGEWCRFCKFKPMCKAVHDENMKLIKEDFRDPTKLTEEEILFVYKKADEITLWINSIQQFVLNKLLSKEPIHGYKLVEGRSNRKFKNPADIQKILIEKGFDKSEFLTEPKLEGITKIEKLLGRKEFELSLGEHVYKDSGKPTVAPESDKRKSYFDTPEEDFSEKI